MSKLTLNDKRSGKARIAPWISLKKLIDYDPNIYAVQHSNTLAYLDCYLQYKNSVEFIIFSPLDEVVLPHVEQSYPAEFRALFLSRGTPLIHYNIKRTQGVAHKSMVSFMPSDILHGINFNGTVGNHIRIADIRAVNQEEV
uniref:Glycosyltransferase family 92 protein n=1 Tax=Heterorhabditis bacteriophora TaxID=37862 RepID=A0A1I7XDE8_HETBA